MIKPSLSYVALFVCILIAVAFFGYRYFNRPPPVPVSKLTSFLIIDPGIGRANVELVVSAGEPIFGEIVKYVSSPSVTDGELNLANYAPCLTIRTDIVSIKFSGNQVLVSTRESVKHSWHPIVRQKTPEDVQFESKIRDYIESLAQHKVGG